MNRLSYHKFLIVMLVSLLSLSMNAQDEDETPHWMGLMSAGLNTDGYEFELGCTWLPVQNFGVRLSIGMAGEIEEISDWDCWYDDDYYHEDEHDYATRFKFMASLDLRSPTLFRISDGTFHLFGCPGLGFSPGASGSKNAKTTFWQLRGGICCEVEEVVIGLSYGYSNFNLYSGDPYSHNGHPENPNRCTHSVTLSFALKF